MTLSTVSWSVSEERDNVNGVEESTTTNEKIISLYKKGDRIGACVWSASSPDYFILAREQSHDQSFYQVDKVLTEVKPDVVLIPAKTDRDFLSGLRETLIAHASGSRENSSMVFGMTIDFKQSVATSRYPFEEEDIQGNSCSICACAGLISHLRREKEEILLPGIVEWFSTSETVDIDYDTLLAWQVVCDDRHPNAHYTVKTGLSLLGVMNQCVSPGGRALLKKWILRPSLDINVIRQRHSKVELMIDKIVRPGKGSALKAILKRVPIVRNAISGILGKPSPKDFIQLSKFLHSYIDIVDIIGVSDLHEAFPPRQTKQETFLINIKASKDQQNIVIKGGINEVLDQLRSIYDNLPDILSSHVQQIAANIDSPSVSVVNIVYFPQLGFLLTIPKGETSFCDLALGEEYNLRFETEKVFYCKDPVTLGLDEGYGDVFADIRDLEVEILRDLAENLSPFTFGILACCEFLAEIDSFLSLAQFAVENDLIKPHMYEDTRLLIKEGRHILQERVTDVMIPNDTEIQDEGNKIILLTGPNSSGKSVYMKQVALIVLMAQMGSYVPAAEAHIGIVDKVFSRILTRESMGRGQSAFQIDLLQIKKALKYKTEKSLLLIDEFGKGTKPLDGMALFAGTIKYLVTRPGEVPPRTIAITHFHEIHQQKMLEDDLPIKWCTMDMLEPNGNNANNAAPVFLYRVVNGKAASSLGLLCAEKAGLPPHILNRAKELAAMFSAKLTPLQIRYASIDEEFEKLCYDIVATIQQDNVDIVKLKELSQKLVNYSSK